MNVINLTIGDWSRDGHNQIETITIETNCTVEQINEISSKVKDVFGFTLDEYCEEYEDNRIPMEIWNKLVAMGFPADGLEYGSPSDLEDDPDGVYLYSGSEYADIWLFMIQRCEPMFTYKIVNNANINIGGYGLFQ